MQLSKLQTNVITLASFVVDRARFGDMNEEVKNEEPFKMHKHSYRYDEMENIFCCYFLRI